MINIHQTYNFARCFLNYKVGHPTPFQVHFEVTDRCNLRCKFCDIWKRKNEEVNLEQAKKIIDNISEAKISIITLTGGEPLLRNDLEDIASYAKSKGMIAQLNTNGTLLTKERVKKIAESFDWVGISLDGLEETHDGIRGIKGTFNKAVKGVKNLNEVKGNCKVAIASVLTKDNYNELIPLFRQAKKLGVDFAYVHPVVEVSFSNPENFGVFPSKRCGVNLVEMNKFIKKLVKEKSKDYGFILVLESFIELMPTFIKGDVPRICDAGKLFLAVNPKGDLFFCPQLIGNNSFKMGSLLKSPLTKILNQKNMKKFMELTKNCRCLSLCTTGTSLTFREPLINLIKQSTKFL